MWSLKKSFKKRLSLLCVWKIHKNNSCSLKLVIVKQKNELKHSQKKQNEDIDLSESGYFKIMLKVNNLEVVNAYKWPMLISKYLRFLWKKNEEER